MSKILEEAKLPSLKDKIEAATPTDTAEAVIAKVKKEDKKLSKKLEKPKVGNLLGVISKKKK